MNKSRNERLQKEKEDRRQEVQSNEQEDNLSEEESEMGDIQERTLREHAAPSTILLPGIVRPTVTANNFELKPGLIQMVQQSQFGGGVTEDANDHLFNFVEICDTIKLNGVAEGNQVETFSILTKGQCKNMAAIAKPRFNHNVGRTS